jgi:3-dehydroquinate synthase
VSESFVVKSHTGPYQVHFEQGALARLNALVADTIHVIIDARIADLYAQALSELRAASVTTVEADERAKTLEQMPLYVGNLLEKGFRRHHRLVAIGGGIIQDITCFLAATMMRGVDWVFFPTTLLAQADSCIGSKSSINVGSFKNVLGTFTPPRAVYIDVSLLTTLDERDARSGVGEILKVHAIEGPDAFQDVASAYERLFQDETVLARYIQRALQIKKRFIEDDEFDRGSRQVFNYGHTFGHAIEAATEFSIPHGIAVTMGMDLANFIAWRLGHSDRKTFDRMHPTLRRNYRGYEGLTVPLDRFFTALQHDKKNIGQGEITAILPDMSGCPVRIRRPADEPFYAACTSYFEGCRLA